MSRAYIYKVTVHAKQVINLRGNRNVLIEEDITSYFNTGLAAQEFSDNIFDQYGWKSSISWKIMFEDTNQGLKDASIKFDEDLREIINSVSPITVAA